jgi:hypothetical protein
VIREVYAFFGAQEKLKLLGRFSLNLVFADSMRKAEYFFLFCLEQTMSSGEEHRRK